MKGISPKKLGEPKKELSPLALIQVEEVLGVPTDFAMEELERACSVISSRFEEDIYGARKMKMETSKTSMSEDVVGRFVSGEEDDGVLEESSFENEDDPNTEDPGKKESTVLEGENGGSAESTEDDEDDEGDSQDGSETDGTEDPPSPGKVVKCFENPFSYLNDDDFCHEIDDLSVGSESVNTGNSKEDKGGKRSPAHRVLDAMRKSVFGPEGLPEACKMASAKLSSKGTQPSLRGHVDHRGELSVGTDFKIKGDMPQHFEGSATGLEEHEAGVQKSWVNVVSSSTHKEAVVPNSSVPRLNHSSGSNL
ncbi:hypothetical protein U1Q18_010419 [Sarracenia purpurea var. burkii]